MDDDDYSDRIFIRERSRQPVYIDDYERVKRPIYYTHAVEYLSSENDEDTRNPRGRRAFTSAFPRGRSESLNERRYSKPSRYSSRSRSRIRFRGRSPSPPRHRWDYEESPPPPIPVHVNSSRRHLHHYPPKYVPPVDKEGNPLNLDVNLVSSAKDENVPGWSNRRTEFASQRPESLSLEASRGFADDTETEKIILTLNSESSLSKAENIRWIHLQQDCMSIKSLENLVTQTPDLNDDDMLITLRLLHQVAEKSETPYVHGHYLKATALRGDCHSTGKVTAQQEDRHCTFISFPYFSFQAPAAIPGQQKSRLHPPRGLLQTVHLLESTKFRDAEQAICKLSRPNRFGKFIHVPQVWSIAIGSDLLITYSTMSMPSMRGENIEIQKPLTREKPGPSVLRVMDPYQRIFFFSMDSCKTWFELEELIYTQCGLGPRDFVKNEYNILLKDKKQLVGADWPTIVASEKSPFIDIFVHIKDGPESDESEFDGDGDNYLQTEPRSKFRRDSTYPPVRGRSRRGTQSGRTSLHRYTGSPRQTQRASTRGSRPETPQSTWSHTYDENYSSRRVYIPDAAGAAAVENRRHDSSYANQTDTQEERDNNDLQPTSSETKDGSNTTFNAPKRQNVRHEPSNVTFMIEGDQSMVAEPDSYYSSHESEREHRQSYPSDNNTELALFDRQPRPGSIEPSLHRVQPSRTRLYDTSSLRDMRRPVSRPRRRSTFTEYYNNIGTRLHRALGSQSTGIANNYASSTRRRRVADLNPKSEDGKYFEPTRAQPYQRRRNDDQSLRRAYTPTLYSHRRHHGRSSVHGIDNSTADVTSMNDAEIEADIYYIPKKKEESIPTVNISDEIKTRGAEEFFPSLETNEGSMEQSNIESAQPEPVQPSASSPRERRSGSSSSSRPELPARPFVLPILMWPTGPAEDLSETKTHHQPLKHNMEGPPRARNPDDNKTAMLDQDSDASLAEVLDRVYSSLLTDRLSNHDLIFRQMEIAHRKDATFKIPKQESPPVSEAAGNIDEPRDGTQSGRPKYDPGEGFLNAKPTKDSFNDEARVPEYQTKLLQLSTTANSLLECFVPADYSSPVTWRYYGSIKKTIKTIDEAQKHNSISKLYANQGTVWLIEDISDPESIEKHHLQPLSKTLQSCQKCRERFPYKNETDASNHLLKDHFSSDKQPSVATAMLWVRKHQPLSDMRRCDEHMNILRACCIHLDDIYRFVQEIRDGVCSVGDVHNPRYRLPKALVVAFRKLILYLVYMSHVIDLVTKRSESWTSPNWMHVHDRDITEKVMKLTYIGNSIEDAVYQGKIDLTVMLRTQDYTQSIKRYEAVGPQYILIMVLSNLQFGVECKDLVEVYKEYIARLSFQVSQYPRRRLLRSLKYVEEELIAIHRIMADQHNLYAYFGRVLNPLSFRNTTETRKSMYDLEIDLINKCCFKSNQQLAALEQLLRRVERLTDDTKTSVEINDDDHGKAILVFTIVTLVFLPLSFVASFLGMNTVDIRNQTTSQSLYWIIAVPVTATVVVLALLIGYKYEAMRDYAERYMGKVKKE